MAKMLPRVDSDQNVYDLALERAAYTLANYDHCFVSFSGGKDSTATFQVVLAAIAADSTLERHLPLRLVFFDEEAIAYETEEYVRRVSERDDVNLEWYCLPVQHRNACSRKSPYWWPWAPEARDRWCRPLPPEAITTLDGFPAEPPDARLSIPALAGLLAPPSLGTVGMFMGIRAQESITRTRALRMPRPEQYLIPWTDGTSQGNMTKSYPVYDWMTEDVWTAPAKMGWDYNHAYDRFEELGIGHTGQRCSPAFGEQPLEGLDRWAACFPDVWEKMVDRVPGVGAAVRYAKTELYGSHARPKRPAGTPWPEFVLGYAEKYEPREQVKVRQGLRAHITGHYAKTSAPIFTKAKHPITGVCWDGILRVAIRGDFKGRMMPNLPGSNIDVETWQKYAEKVQAELDSGVTAADLGHPGPLPTTAAALLPAHLRESA